MDLVPTVGMTSGDLSVYQQLHYWISLNDLALPAIMALLTILLVTCYTKFIFSAGFASATEKLRPELNRAQALAVVCEQMNIEMNHMRQEYDHFDRDRERLEFADRQCDEAINVCRRALSESYRHSEVCPIMDPVWVTHDSARNEDVWHVVGCPLLPDEVTNRPGLKGCRPCLRCANHLITPQVEDAQGRTLLRDLEEWITRQGAEAWPTDTL